VINFDSSCDFFQSMYIVLSQCLYPSKWAVMDSSLEMCVVYLGTFSLFVLFLFISLLYFHAK